MEIERRINDMANYCSTEIEILHKNEQAVQNFCEKLEEWTSVQNEYCKALGLNKLKYLGNLVLNSGIAQVTEKGIDRYCRGEILEISKYSPNSIFIATDTADDPIMDIWQDLVDKYLPGAQIIYTAEEPGSGVYWSNNPDIEGKYCVSTDGEDVFVDDELIEDQYYVASEQELTRLLQKVLQIKEEMDVNSLIKLYNCVGYPGLFINKWENALNI